MHLGPSGGDERRQMEEEEERQTRLEVARGPENERDGQGFRGRGQEVAKTWVIIRQNTKAEKHTHTHTQCSSVGAARSQHYTVINIL